MAGHKAPGGGRGGHQEIPGGAKLSSTDPRRILDAKDQSIARLRRSRGDEAETLIADARYGFISGLLKEVLSKPAIDRVTISDWIDRVAVNRWLGIPIFLALLYGMFQFTFTLSVPFMDWIDAAFGWLGGRAAGVGPAWLGSFLAGGIIGGVGSVLVFTPPIFLLFMALSVLEDSGYLARAAFVMDRLMHWIGLHGRSFIPLMLGFGCNVPAVMATRVIENPKDRLVTILVTPFMSCGARLPIYMLLVGAFFTAYHGLVIFSMYVIGILVAIAAAWILRRRLITGPSGHFVMELPPYRLPTIRGVLLHTWERGREFLIRAGTIIFAVVVVVWLLDYTGALEPIGRAIRVLFSPAGFGQWQAAVALVFGLLAKEVVVGTFGTLFGVEQRLLGGALAGQLGWTPLVAYGFMLFTLLYVPCVATITVIRRETRSWRWTGFAVAFTVSVAWVAATVFHQIGRLFAG